MFFSMKTLLYFLFFIFFPFGLFISCSKDKLEEEGSISIKKTEGVKNGIYHFSSRESLKDFIENMKNNEILFQQTMKRLYLNGFSSRTPVGFIDEDRELFDIMEKKYGKDSDEIIDEIEKYDLVKDPILSALINDKNEIIVNDTLYKFTNRGLFFSKINDTTKLVNFLNKKSFNGEDIYEEEYYHRGVVKVEDGIYRFLAPLENNEDFSNKINIISKNIPLSLSYKNSNPIYDDFFKDIAPIINNLPIASEENNWFLHTLFGTSKVATDYFDRRHRVKIEFWNQNYGFYKSVGVSVRNQVRRFRIWWASKADEVVLGINYAKMTFVFPKPPITQFSQYSDVLFSNKERAMSYIYNGYVYSYKGSPLMAPLSVEKVPLPFFKFDKEEILNIYIPKIPIVNHINYTLRTEDIVSPNNIKLLYQEGFNLLKSLSSSKNKFAVIKEKNENEIDVVYLTKGYRNRNTNKVKARFDSDFGGSLGYKANVGNSINGSWNISTVQLRDYKNIKLDFYGMARRGNTWKGSRVIYNQ